MLIDEKYKTYETIEYENHKMIFQNIQKDGNDIFTISMESKNALANVIVVPPFGKTSHQDLMVAFYLMKNNVNVVRFDGVDSVGFSTGSIYDYKLSQLENNMHTLSTLIKKNSDLPLICLSASLSFPTALNCACTHPELFEKLVTIVGVIDAEQTVSRVIKRPMNEWAEKRSDAAKEMVIFGSTVEAPQFCDDMWKNNYSGIENSIKRANKLKCPLKMIVADQDQYVLLDEFIKFKNSSTADIQYMIIEGASHEIGRSLALGKKVCQKVVEYITEIDESKTVIPKITDIVKFSSIETQHLNKYETLMSN